MITLGSLFDGIGGWQLAAVKNGVKPLWSSEIDPFPASITEKHFPDTIQLGDVTKIDGAKIAPVDIICAGSPCQDLSIAGKRAGLEGKRSNLFYHAMRIVREMRWKTNGVYPKFFVWENVTGVFTSNGGRDFQSVLEEIGQTDIPMPRGERWARAGMVRSKDCGIAWRVLDAQFWGVPQHRERIFLVAGFRKIGGAVGEILFRSKSMHGGFEKSESEEQRTSEVVRSRTDSAKRVISENVVFQKEWTTGGSKGDRIRVNADKACTLSASVGGGASKTGLYLLKDSDRYIVRRLTPLECERLQGLPDNWTAYGSDSKRYKAIGNGMAQPCADFVIEKLAEALRKEQ